MSSITPDNVPQAVDLNAEEYNSVIENICDAIADKNWSVTDGIFSEDFLNDLIREVSEQWEEGEFRKAGIGTGASLTVRPEIRSDRVLWLDPDDLSALQKKYTNFIDQLRQSLNRSFYLSAKEFEGHFAVYPAGSFYKKHLDQFSGVKHRVITCILYLNEAWKTEDGGELRIYNEDETSTHILPQKGRFICFRSDAVYHEVLPTTNRERFSLTGWIRTA